MKRFFIASLVAICVLCSHAFSDEYYITLKVNNGKYVFPSGYGGGPPSGNGIPYGRLLGTQASTTGFSTNFIVRNGGGPLTHLDYVTIRAGTQGLWVTAEDGGGGAVNANRTGAGPWELFRIYKVSGSGGSTIVSGDYIGLQTSDGHYVCAENGGDTYLIADRTAIGPWETFQLATATPPGPGGAYWPPRPSPAYTYWNDYAWAGKYGRQAHNNCYNWGGNRVTNSYAKPGQASGNGTFPTSFTEASIVIRMERDGWEHASAFATSPEGKMLVFLTLASSSPGVYFDFHYYRYDSAGWTHKVAWLEAKQVDESGNTITDPRTCDRGGYDYYNEDSAWWFIPTTLDTAGGYANIK